MSGGDDKGEFEDAQLLTFLNLHRLNSNSFTRWFFIEAITIGHYIYSANHIRTTSSNQNLLNFSGELESPPWKKSSLN